MLFALFACSSPVQAPPSSAVPAVLEAEGPIACVDPGRRDVSVFEEKSSRALIPDGAWLHGGGLTVEDLDGDGHMDIFIPGEQRSDLRWGLGGGLFTELEAGEASLRGIDLRAGLYRHRRAASGAGAEIRQFRRRELLHPRLRGDAVSAESKARDAIARFGKSIFDRGLTFGSSGNISVRLEDGWLMTPTGSTMGELDPARLSKLGLDGRHIGGDKPTKETFLHLGMYGARQDARAVVHLHSTHSVAVSVLADIDPADVIPPITAYYVMRVGRLPLVPYFRPGDPALGPAVGALAGRHHAVLLANHGPVVAGTSLESAVFATEELEETAKLFLLLHGRAIRPLTHAQVSELIQA